MVTRIKICGFTRQEDVAEAVKQGIHALGFVFYPASGRYVSGQQAAELMAGLPPFITTVGLFVNAGIDEVISILSLAPVNLLQFHGDETPEQCHALANAVQRPFIRAMRVKSSMNSDDLIQYEALYRSGSPWFSGILLDSFVDGFGGSGKAFDWSIIPSELAPRVVLSGGLTVHNAVGAVLEVRPCAVDISSGVEQSKGVKDHKKMHAFIQAVQLADTTLSESSLCNLHQN